MIIENKISVCMATFNGADHIHEQLESILSQLSDRDEVIICDDQSTDQTLEIIKKFLPDPRIIIHLNDKQNGVIKNFETAIQMSSGDYIFLCDQDDVWLPNKINKMIAALATNILVVSDCKVVDAQLNILHSSFFKLRNSGSGILRNIFKNGYLGCCMGFRKELTPHALPIPDRSPMHDMWIGIIAETVGKVSFIPEQLVLYRRHGKNASPTAEKSGFNLYQQIKFRLTLSYLIFIRYIRNIAR